MVVTGHWARPGVLPPQVMSPAPVRQVSKEQVPCSSCEVSCDISLLLCPPYNPSHSPLLIFRGRWGVNYAKLRNRMDRWGSLLPPQIPATGREQPAHRHVLESKALESTQPPHPRDSAAIKEQGSGSRRRCQLTADGAADGTVPAVLFCHCHFQI